MDNNIVNERYLSVLENVSKILSLEERLKKARTDSERQSINSEIDIYKSYIDKYTNNSSDYILNCSKKILSAKEKLSEETNENAKKLLDNGIITYIRYIKSHISEEPSDIAMSKSVEFRQKQHISDATIDPIAQVMEIDKWCTENKQRNQVHDSNISPISQALEIDKWCTENKQRKKSAENKKRSNQIEVNRRFHTGTER